MSLVRCTQLLRRKNGHFLSSLKNSTVFFSDDKKSSGDGTENDQKSEANEKDNDKKPSKQGKASKGSFSPESQNRLNDLLKKLSSRSTLGTVKEVQGSKPLGYRNLRQTQRLDAKERKPRNLGDAAEAVSQELGDEKITNDILEPIGAQKDEYGFLECVCRSEYSTI